MQCNQKQRGRESSGCGAVLQRLRWPLATKHSVNDTSKEIEITRVEEPALCLGFTKRVVA